MKTICENPPNLNLLSYFLENVINNAEGIYYYVT